MLARSKPIIRDSSSGNEPEKPVEQAISKKTPDRFNDENETNQVFLTTLTELMHIRKKKQIRRVSRYDEPNLVTVVEPRKALNGFKHICKYP